MPRRLVPMILIAACLSGGCVREVEIDVVQRAGRIGFVVTRGGEPACVDRISVHAGTEAVFDPLWSIAAMPDGSCRSSFVLGESPRGFSASGKPAPGRVKPGATLTVLAEGPGLIGSKTFRAD